MRLILQIVLYFGIFKYTLGVRHNLDVSAYEQCILDQNDSIIWLLLIIAAILNYYLSLILEKNEDEN